MFVCICTSRLAKMLSVTRLLNACQYLHFKFSPNVV